MPEERVAARYRRLFVRGSGADRIAYFSDAVFAIAMTLLVLDLRIPDGATSALAVVQAEWPSYLSFALSFVVIAWSWIGHHRRFKAIVAHDTGLIVINLGLLFVIVSIPFATSLLGEFSPELTSVVLYAACVMLIAVMELAEWLYLRRRRLLAPWVDGGVFLYVLWDILPVVIVFGGSIIVAFAAGGAVAMYCWFAMFVVSPVAGALVERRIDRARPGGSEAAEADAEAAERGL